MKKTTLEGHVTIGNKTFECGKLGTLLATGTAVVASYYGFVGTDELMEMASLDHGYLRTIVDTAGIAISGAAGLFASLVPFSYLPGGRRY